MDALDALSSDSGSEGEQDDYEPTAHAKQTKAAASKLGVQDLVRAGYEAGPSVLFVPEQKSRSGPESWEWSDGRDKRDREAEPSKQVCVYRNLVQKGT
jgi:hypothetical protein